MKPLLSQIPPNEIIKYLQICHLFKIYFYYVYLNVSTLGGQQCLLISCN